MWQLTVREGDRKHASFEEASLDKKVLSVEVLLRSDAAVGSSWCPEYNLRIRILGIWRSLNEEERKLNGKCKTISLISHFVRHQLSPPLRQVMKKQQPFYKLLCAHFRLSRRMGHWQGIIQSSRQGQRHLKGNRKQAMQRCLASLWGLADKHWVT